MSCLHQQLLIECMIDSAQFITEIYTGLGDLTQLRSMDRYTNKETDKRTDRRGDKRTYRSNINIYRRTLRSPTDSTTVVVAENDEAHGTVASSDWCSRRAS